MTISVKQYRALLSDQKDVKKARSSKKNISREEENLQRACIQWADSHRNVYPDLEYLFHPANGGGRTIAESGILKATGVRAGVSDLLLPFTSPHTKLRGLALELKSPKGKLSDSQRRWLKRFLDDGYLVAIIRSIDDFIGCVKTWYGIDNIKINGDFEISLL